VNPSIIYYRGFLCVYLFGAGSPLYDTLRPYLQHQGGFIKFNRPVNGVEKSFTIRVGLTSDSIYFTTPATEEVIEFVRNQVII